jgi:glycine dehydrogenase
MSFKHLLSETYSDHAPTPFTRRHLGPVGSEQQDMLATLGLNSLESLASEVVPPAIRRDADMNLPAPLDEEAALRELRHIASQNQVWRCHLGQGYFPSVMPGVILRNILENPGWYTQYTPYQAEIAQGRLEGLLNFQTLITELTGLPYANASLLDEATACGEALGLAHAHGRGKRNTVLVDRDLHPQNLQVIRTRADALGIEVREADLEESPVPPDVSAVFVQSPDTRGRIRTGIQTLAERAHAAGALLVCAVDPLAQCLLKTPGELGADIAVGSTQRFGLPMGFGGPHAGFMAVTDPLKRRLPGRIVGVSVDTKGRPAYRLALQTREQHIRRDKATSNICTAQVLPALLAAMYAIYHGPEGLRSIAKRVAGLTCLLRHALSTAGFRLLEGPAFDTLCIALDPEALAGLRERAEAARINLRFFEDDCVGISLDETTQPFHILELLELFEITEPEDTPTDTAALPEEVLRTGDFLPQEIFHSCHSEHEMLRYLHRLQSRDLSLAHSMIPLGSCTMKLNATAEMIPVTWPEFGNIHPAAPADQTRGYAKLCQDLEHWLGEITAFPVCSLQPNAGSQGEFAGLLAIREYHLSRGDAQRTLCLIPASAHGTNPASAVMAGFEVMAVKCDDDGNVDVADLTAKAEAHADRLGALMITYPSTHGVFEESVKTICETVHTHGGQVYMDGANMNAQVGLTAPGIIGADVCHLNLHKTFCIPHGGGGPGMGPICAAEHLRPFMPTDPFAAPERPLAISATAFGSASILVIPWMYIRMCGAEGLTQATSTALLNANYMAKRLEGVYPVLYRGRNGRVAHEFILDLRDLTRQAGLVIDDIAKRLMDYGFHAPTMSFPVPGTLMIEPTESETRAELDRFCDAMTAIRAEIQAVLDGGIHAAESPLHHAPHTADDISGEWTRAYTRETAAFPLPYVRERKFWPFVGRIDNTYGDRNLVCTCEWNPKV